MDPRPASVGAGGVFGLTMTSPPSPEASVTKSSEAPWSRSTLAEGHDHRQLVVGLHHVAGAGIGQRLEVHVVGVGAVGLAADFEPQGQRVRLGLVGQHLEHGGPGLGGDRQYGGDVLTVFTHACHHKGVSPSHKHVPDDAHEWVSFDDPDEERTWLFDVTFLASAWTCIFGHGCQGVLTGPAPELVQGCCSYGAHFTGKKDADKVERGGQDPRTRACGSSTSKGRKGVVKKLPDGDLGTRLVDGACIFLNRPGLPGRSGMRPPPRGRGPGGEPRRAQARGVLAAAAAPRGRDGTRRPGHLGGPPVGPPPLGRRAARSSTGGAPRTPRPSSATTRSTGPCAPSSRRWRARRSTSGWPPTSTSGPAPRVRVTLLPHPTRRAAERRPGRRPLDRPATRPAGRPRRSTVARGAVPRISS